MVGGCSFMCSRLRKVLLTVFPLLTETRFPTGGGRFLERTLLDRVAELPADDAGVSRVSEKLRMVAFEREHDGKPVFGDEALNDMAAALAVEVDGLTSRSLV